MAATMDTKSELEQTVQDILAAIERPREADIIAYRYGLNGDRKTLEQVGELLGITRERVRQIEKATLIRIKLGLEDGKNAKFNSAELDLTKALHEMGRAAKVDDITKKIMGEVNEKNRAIITLLAELSPKMLLTSENDRYYSGIIMTSDRNDRATKAIIDSIVKALKNNGKPVTIDQLFKIVGGFEHPSEVSAMAGLSKKITHLNNLWGLSKWPSVNPKNIRDKIYVVLKESNDPMHFSDIAATIKSNRFSRNNVTDQAIHNELIKDNRFVLIGRGIYALAERGFKKGSIVQVITELLKEKGPMHRDDIVREVLKMRRVRETTILLNLQSKPQFVRTDKNEYGLKSN